MLEKLTVQNCGVTGWIPWLALQHQDGRMGYVPLGTTEVGKQALIALKGRFEARELIGRKLECECHGKIIEYLGMKFDMIVIHRVIREVK